MDKAYRIMIYELEQENAALRIENARLKSVVDSWVNIAVSYDHTMVVRAAMAGYDMAKREEKKI